MISITNNKDTSRSQSFTYDVLNRLTSAQTTGSDCSQFTVNNKTKSWGNNYTYDSWGNLLAKNITKCNPENMDRTADGQNRLHVKAGADFQYDAAGNMTYDTVGQYYSYDQENRITGAAGYTYTYDADGNRVEKTNGTTGTLYWYMGPGVVSESDLTGALKSEYAFFGSERVARIDFPGNAVSYYLSDPLKTTDIVIDSAGNIKSDSDFYPWGGELQFLANDSNHYKYGGHERDSESGLDYYGARYYGNVFGRFLTPDWASHPIAVPYADFGNPQSLKLYVYTKNNPRTFGDPDGHCCEIAAGIAIGVGKFLWNNSPVGMATNGVRESIRDLKAGPKAAEAKAHAQLHALGTVAAAASGDVGAQAQIGMAAANVWNNASTTDKASMATQGVLTAASMFAPVGLESSLARGTATATETLTASTDLFVIGRQADTAAYVGQSGFNVLNVPSAAWTPELNAAWVQSGIDGGNNFLLASPLTGPNLFSEEFGQTMFATELDQLNAATYTQVGNTMVAPGSANVPH